jgi:hypothetical protein
MTTTRTALTTDPALTRTPGPGFARNVRRIAGGVVVVHGLLHLLGAAAPLGWTDDVALRLLPGTGPAWLLAALLVGAAGVGLLAGRRQWWLLGTPAVVLSQVLIVTSWQDAWAGSVANLILLVAVIHGWRAEGPGSGRARFRRGMAEALTAPSTTELLTDADLAHLPEPVARYIRRTGAVGRPKVTRFTAKIHGRIRAGHDQPWMPFTGEQVNTCGPSPSRLFRIKATMRGLPTDVLHVLVDGRATMRAAVCSIVPVVEAAGPEMDRAETVTLFNDLCVLAPAALVDAPIAWSMADRRVRGSYTNGQHTVEAELVFDADGDLVDFMSDDRAQASADGKTFVAKRWSTPLTGYREVRGRRLSTVGTAVWDAPEPGGPFAYLEFFLDDLSTD